MKYTVGRLAAASAPLKNKRSNISLRIAKIAGASLLTAVLTSHAHAAAPVYRLIDLNPSDEIAGMTATGINNLGQVIGHSWTVYGEMEAFSWQAGQGLTKLGAPQGIASLYTSHINDAGTAVMNVVFTNPATGQGTSYGYSWQQGSGFTLLSNGGPGTAGGVNNAGQIAGSMTVGDRQQAGIWSNGVFAPLPGLGSDDISSAAYRLNEKGDVIGVVFNANGHHPVIWRNGQITEVEGLPGAEITGLIDINASGQIVGFSSMGYMDYQPVQIQPGAHQVQSMNMGGQLYEATGINDSGVIIGHRAMSYNQDNAFYWSQETGGVSMISLIDPATLPTAGVELQQLFDINDKGQIVGSALIGGHYHAVLLDPVTPVPEPGTLALSVLGVMMLVARVSVRRTGVQKIHELPLQ
jgi:probable HAF family extracellular repeat protein